MMALSAGCFLNALRESQMRCRHAIAFVAFTMFTYSYEVLTSVQADSVPLIAFEPEDEVPGPMTRVPNSQNRSVICVTLSSEMGLASCTR